MTPCAPGTLAPTDVPPFSGAPIPPGGTRLVLFRDTPTAFTTRQETDARTALTRGLAEYVATLQHDAVGGRNVAFKQVIAEYADAEDLAVYPSACAYATGDQTYDAGGFKPQVVIPGWPNNLRLVHVDNLDMEVRLTIYATDKEERVALMIALEAAFHPVEWMSGFRLDLPHYFNARADFLALRAGYEDDATQVMQRWRKATIILAGRVAVGRVQKFPGADPRTVVTATEGA